MAYIVTGSSTCPGTVPYPKETDRVTTLKACLTLLVISLAACSTANINVPAIGGADEEARLPGKIIWHELLTDTPAQTQTFYSELFGWEFEPLPDTRLNYLMIRHGGKLIGGMIDQTQLPTDADISQWVSLIAVTDIAAATEHVRDTGGTVFTPPTSLGERGMISVVADPQGALFALLQTRDGDPADRTELPGPGEFLWNELWTGSVGEAVDFYRQLAPYQLEEKSFAGVQESIDFQVLSSNGQARAGIRSNPFEGLPPIWLNYVRVEDAKALDDILSRVEALGGEVLVPVVDRPGGGKVAMIAGPSGAGIALQTWPDEQRVAEIGGDKE